MGSTTQFKWGLSLGRQRLMWMFVVVLLAWGGVVVGTGHNPVSAQTETPNGLEVSVDPVSVTEGNSGETDMEFTVRLSGSPSHRVRLLASARALAGQAVGADRPGRDFVSFRNQSVVFEAGATGAGLSQTVTVKVLGDEVDEKDEKFTFKLGGLESDDTRVVFTGG